MHLIKEVTVTLMRQSRQVQGFVLFSNNLYSDFFSFFLHVSPQKRARETNNTKQHRIKLNQENNLDQKNAHKHTNTHTRACTHTRIHKQTGVKYTDPVSGQRQLTPAADCSVSVYLHKQSAR